MGHGNTSADSGALPPLREIIWRRLRRRNAQLHVLDEEIGAETGRERSRHREMLSWMVDQLSIDQHQQQAAAAAAAAAAHAASSSSGVQPASARINYLPPMSGGDSSLPRRPTRIQNFRLRYAADGVPPRAASLRSNDAMLIHHTPSNMLLTHRIQAWDMHSRHEDFPPDISDASANIVVKEAKIHNDASVDMSEDGTILVTLVPSNLPMTTVVGVYGLSGSERGQCYATYCLESSAVSVSLSPTARHLLVGLTTRAARITLSPADRSVMAQVRSQTIGGLVSLSYEKNPFLGV